MVAEQLERLSRAEMRVLEAASVAGLEFGAQAVAAALGKSVEEIEACCDAIGRRRQLLAAEGAAVWADGSMGGRYRFTHPLYRNLLYDQLPPGRRSRLHRLIGDRLESGYGIRAEEITAELALHFEVGRDHGRSLTYNRRAGLAEVNRAATPEGVRHLQAALRALEHAPQGPDRSAQESELLTALGPALASLKGFNAPEVARCSQRALEVSEQLGDRPATFAALVGIGRSYRGTVNAARCIEVGERLLSIAASSRNPAKAIAAHHFMGSTQLWVADLKAARQEFEAVLQISDVHPDAPAAGSQTLGLLRPPISRHLLSDCTRIIVRAWSNLSTSSATRSAVTCCGDGWPSRRPVGFNSWQDHGRWGRPPCAYRPLVVCRRRSGPPSSASE